MTEAKLKSMVNTCIRTMNSVQDGLVNPNIIKEVKLNKRMTRSLGKCKKRHDSFHLHFSHQYYTSEHTTEEQKLRTIYHELTHTVKGCFNHGNEFKRVGRMIERATGIKGIGDTYNTSLTNEYRASTYKYRIDCDSCGKVGYRNRSMGFKTRDGYVGGYRCGKCGESTLIETKNKLK